MAKLYDSFAHRNFLQPGSTKIERPIKWNYGKVQTKGDRGNFSGFKPLNQKPQIPRLSVPSIPRRASKKDSEDNSGRTSQWNFGVSPYKGSNTNRKTPMLDGRRSDQNRSRSLSHAREDFPTRNSLPNTNRTLVKRDASNGKASQKTTDISFMPRQEKRESSESSPGESIQETSSSDGSSTMREMLKETTKLLNMVQQNELADEGFTNEYEYAHSEDRWHKDFESMDEDEKIAYFKSTYHMKPEQINELTFHPKTNQPKKIHKTYTGNHMTDRETRIDSARTTASNLSSRPNSQIGNINKKVMSVPSHQRKDFMLSRLQGNIYHRISQVYGVSPRDNRENRFYQKLSQVQTDEFKNRNEMFARNERKRVDSWFRQKDQLEYLRKKYEKAAWKRFMTQYVTSKVVKAEHTSRKEYGLPNTLEKDLQVRKNSLDDRDPSKKEKTNKKKFGYLFKYGISPDVKIRRTPMKFEGIDSVYMDAKNKKGEHTTHRVIVAKVIKEARFLISEKRAPRRAKPRTKPDKYPLRPLQDTRNRLARPHHHRTRAWQSTENNYTPSRRSQSLTETPRAPKTITDMMMKRQSLNNYRTPRAYNPDSQPRSKSVYPQMNDSLSKNKVPLRSVSEAGIHRRNFNKPQPLNQNNDTTNKSKPKMDTVQNRPKRHSTGPYTYLIPKRPPSVLGNRSKASRTDNRNGKQNIEDKNSVARKDMVNKNAKQPGSRSKENAENKTPRDQESKIAIRRTSKIDTQVGGGTDVVIKIGESNNDITSEQKVQNSDTVEVNTIANGIAHGEGTQQQQVAENDSAKKDAANSDEILKQEDKEKSERNRPTQLSSNSPENKRSTPRKGYDRLPTTKELKEKSLAHKQGKSRFPDININNKTVPTSPQPDIKRSVKNDEVESETIMTVKQPHVKRSVKNDKVENKAVKTVTQPNAKPNVTNDKKVTETTRTVTPPEDEGTSKWKDLVQKYLIEPNIDAKKTKRKSVFQTDPDSDSDSEADIFERARRKYGLNVGDDSDDDDV